MLNNEANPKVQRDADEKPSSSPLIPELLVSNINNSLIFYTAILGFTIEYRRDEAGFAMLERQGARIMLEQIQDNQARCWIAAPLEAPLGRGINLQIQTVSIDELYARLVRVNARIFLPMEEMWYRCNKVLLGNRQFIVQDLDGYLLRFFEDLGERQLEECPT